ncbi:MAG: hypothetical protein GY862_23130 [Gammaproteobacteria bacterium]|nr:hypothetical protein [Gammaproteobacteria bacterium]
MPINHGLPSAPQKPAALAKLRSALHNMQHALNLTAVMRRMGTRIGGLVISALLY